MNLLSPQFTDILGSVLLHSFWQISLVAMLYAAFRILIRQSQLEASAKALYWTGCICLVAMLFAPAVSFFYLLNHSHSAQASSISLNQPAPSMTWQTYQPELREVTSTIDSTASHVSSPRGFTSHPFPFDNGPESNGTTILPKPMGWLVIIWVLGACVFGLRPVAGLIHARRLARSGRNLTHPQLYLSTIRIAERLQINSKIQLIESNMVHVPTVVGYFKPIILIPAMAISGLSEQQLTLILTHELAHIRRHDYVINLGQTLIESLLFYHPAMWWISHQIRAERENCCDDIAANLCGSPASMAAALLALEESRVLPPALAANGGQLVARVKRLLRQPETRYSTGQGLSAMALFAFLSTVAFSTAIANQPGGQDRVPVSAAPLEPLQSVINSPIDTLKKTIIDEEQTEKATTQLNVKIDDEPIAIVNGNTIFRERIVDLTTERHGKNVLQSMINNILLEQECENRGITITDNNVLEFARSKADLTGLTVEKYMKLIESKRKISHEQALKILQAELTTQEILLSIHAGPQITNLTAHEPTTPKSLLDELRKKSVIQIDLEDKNIATINGRHISKQQYRDECFSRFGLRTLDLEISRILLKQALEQEDLGVTEKELARVRGKQSHSTSMLFDTEAHDIEVWNSLALEKLAEARLNTSIQPEELEKTLESNFGPRANVLALITSDQKTAQKCWQLITSAPSTEYFQEMANRYSTDPISKNYGEVPPIRRHNGRPRIEEAAFALKKGEISEILEVNNQWLIMYGLGQTKPDSVLSKEEQLQQANSILFEKKRLQAMRDKMQSLLASAKINRVVQAPGDLPVRVPGINAARDQQVNVKTYAVADLVVAHNSFFVDQGKDLGDKKFDFEPLTQLIKDTIDPDSWNNLGSIQGYEPTLSLIVSQTRKNHAALQDLLAKLRELDSITLTTHSFFAIIPKEELRNIDFEPGQPKPISRIEAKMLQATAVAKDNIASQNIPAHTIYNGQKWVIDLNTTDTTNQTLAIQQTIDRSKTKVRCILWLPDIRREGIHLDSIKSNQFMAVDLTRLLGLDPEESCAVFVFRTQIVENK